MKAVHWLTISILLSFSVLTYALPVARFYPSDPKPVVSLPGFSEEITGQEAGYLKANSTASGEAAYLFYWFAEIESGDKKAPIVIWLNGGPGTSSLMGLFTENGPFQIDQQAMKAGNPYYIKRNPYSWHKVAAYLMIDQPSDVGFSFASDSGALPKTDTDATRQLYNGLQAFFNLHPDFRNRPLYIFGESYAGHYIPDIATLIEKMNSQQQAAFEPDQNSPVELSNPQPINLSGIGIGGPWVDPKVQFLLMLDYLIEQSTLTNIQILFASKGKNACLNAINAHKKGEEPAKVNEICMTYADYLVKASGRNINNILLPAPGYDFGFLADYLNKESVRSAVHAIPAAQHKWINPSAIIAKRLAVGEENSKAYLFPDLIDKMPVLLYHGNLDICCNYAATVGWLSSLTWSGQPEFATTVAKNDLRDGKIYQTHRHAGNLTLYTFQNAGHLVPMDQPADALSMLHNFLYPGKRVTYSNKPSNGTVPYRLE